VPGVSDRIRVRSVVGRFLEHSRVFYFHAAGKQLVYLSSADWMERNLAHRVEIVFPLNDERLKQRVIHESLELPLADNTQSWLLQADGSYKRARPGKGRAKGVQQTLIEDLAESPAAEPESSEVLEIARPTRLGAAGRAAARGRKREGA
jgi:polyphosphate kinase